MAVVATSPYFLRVFLPNSSVVSSWSADLYEELSEKYAGHAADVTCVFNGSRAVFSTDATGVLAAWNPKTAKELWRVLLPSHFASVAAALGPSGAGPWAAQPTQRLAARQLLVVDDTVVVLTVPTYIVSGGRGGALSDREASEADEGAARDSDPTSGGAEDGMGGDDGVGDDTAAGRFEYFDDGVDDEEAEAAAEAERFGEESVAGPPLAGMLRVFSGTDGKELPDCPFFRNRDRIGTATRCLLVPLDSAAINAPSALAPSDSRSAAQQLGATSSGLIVVGYANGGVELWDTAGRRAGDWELRWYGQVPLQLPSSAAHGGDEDAAAATPLNAGIAVLRVVAGVLVAGSRTAACAWDLSWLLGRKPPPVHPPDKHDHVQPLEALHVGGLLAWLHPRVELWHTHPLTAMSVSGSMLYTCSDGGAVRAWQLEPLLVQASSETGTGGDNGSGGAEAVLQGPRTTVDWNGTRAERCIGNVRCAWATSEVIAHRDAITHLISAQQALQGPLSSGFLCCRGGAAIGDADNPGAWAVVSAGKDGWVKAWDERTGDPLWYVAGCCVVPSRSGALTTAIWTLRVNQVPRRTRRGGRHAAVARRFTS